MILTKKSAPVGKVAKIFHFLAKTGREGRRRSYVCVDVTVSLFGIQIMIRVVVILWLMCGVEIKV